MSRRNRLARRRGATAVEFAFLAPIVLVLTFGVMDYTWYMHMTTAVQDVTRDAVRRGVTQDMDDTIDGVCELCEKVARTVAEEGLAFYNLPVDGSVYTEVVRLDDGSWALGVMIDAPYSSIVGGIVPTPHYIRTQLAWNIENQ